MRDHKTRDEIIAEHTIDACVAFLIRHALDQALVVSKEYAEVTQGNANLIDTCVRMKIREILEKVPT